eukprot:SAG31_NODE_7372_length_1707_cov_2.414801_2_plen_201_part_00
MVLLLKKFSWYAQHCADARKASRYTESDTHFIAASRPAPLISEHGISSVVCSPPRRRRMCEISIAVVISSTDSDVYSSNLSAHEQPMSELNINIMQCMPCGTNACLRTGKSDLLLSTNSGTVSKSGAPITLSSSCTNHDKWSELCKFDNICIQSTQYTAHISRFIVSVRISTIDDKHDRIHLATRITLYRVHEGKAVVSQ